MVVKGLQITNAERADAVYDAVERILEAVEDVRQAVRGTEHEDRVERTMLAHIVCSTTRDHDWLDRSPCLTDGLDWTRYFQLADDRSDMATGRSNYLTKQTGEYVVAAELSRRGFIATTFTGNVPSYDIVAVDDQGGHALVQVKAIAAGSWQLNVSHFADIEFDGPRQIIRGQLDDPYPDLVCVMVQLAQPDSGRPDRFFVLPWRELARIVIDGYAKYLAKHGGVRPRKPASLHVALKPEALASWEGRWQVLKQRVRPTPANKALQPPSRPRKVAKNKRLPRAARRSAPNS